MEDLKVLYFTVGDKARIFAIACKELATYVCDSEIKEGDATGFSSFLSVAKEYLGNCKSYHEKYTLAFKEFRDEVRRVADRLETDKTQLQKGINKAHWVSGTGVGFTSIVSGLGSWYLISAFVFPPATIAAAAGCVVAGGLSLAGVLEWSLSDQKKQVKGKESNEELLTNCYTALTQVRTTIEVLQDNVDYNGVAAPNVVCTYLKCFKELMIRTQQLVDEYLKTTSDAFYCQRK